jgi:hypothetical protein
MTTNGTSKDIAIVGHLMQRCGTDQTETQMLMQHHDR